MQKTIDEQLGDILGYEYEPRSWKQNDPLDISKVMTLYRQGFSYSEIADQMGMTRNKVAGIIYRSNKS